MQTVLQINSTGAGGASPGDLYVADSGNNRLDEFSSTGAFVRAFGYDVVSSGAGNSTVNAEYELKVVATGGTFRIFYEESSRYLHFSEDRESHTAPLLFDASPRKCRVLSKPSPRLAPATFPLPVALGMPPAPIPTALSSQVLLPATVSKLVSRLKVATFRAPVPKPPLKES